VKRSGGSAHHCQSPTPAANGCDLTAPTRTHTSEQQYKDRTASNRQILQIFSRGTFSRSIKRASKISLIHAQGFSKIWSVVLRSGRKPHWVSSSFLVQLLCGIFFPGTWRTLLQGGWRREIYKCILSFLLVSWEWSSQPCTTEKVTIQWKRDSLHKTVSTYRREVGHLPRPWENHGGWIF